MLICLSANTMSNKCKTHNNCSITNKLLNNENTA